MTCPDADRYRGAWTSLLVRRCITFGLLLFFFARNDGIPSHSTTDRADGRVCCSFLGKPLSNSDGLAEPVPMPKVRPPIPDLLEMA
jgi:hypothetical protein